MPAPARSASSARARRSHLALRAEGVMVPMLQAHQDEIELSHSRCKAMGLSRIEQPDFSPISRADLAISRDRNQRLHSHAAPIMEMLYEQIVNTQSMVVLCDATGTVIHSIGDDDFLARATQVALAPGVNWSESSKGTNAVGTALVSEKPTLVHAEEHYLHANHFLTCSATPILDPRGNILGVLDVSGDHRSYHQHTMALVKMSARMIENHWLADDYHHALRLHFHTRVGFLGTLMEGILAVSPDGRFVGANRSALELLGLSGAALRMQRLESLFGLSVGALVDRFRSPLATPLEAQTPAGQVFHVLARFNWPVWSQVTDAAAASVPPVIEAAEAVPAGVRPPGQRTGLSLLLTGDTQVGAVVERVRRVMDEPIPILILGETGTGKSLLASAIHADSARAAKPWVSFNGAALSDMQAQNALLAAVRTLQTEGGSLYLQNVGEMPLPLQARLQQAMQTATSASPEQAGRSGSRFSLICSSQTSLADRVRDRTFREDLFYSINALTVRLPPLRERTDVHALAQRVWARSGQPGVLQLDAEVQALFAAFAWPGNVRQLSNVLRTAALLAGTVAGQPAPIALRHLPEELLQHIRAEGQTAAAMSAQKLPAEASLGELQLAAVQQALAAAKGNISEAAKRLGVSRNTVYRSLRRVKRNPA